MFNPAIVVLLFCFVGVTWAQIDCSTLPDGSYGYGCRSYTKCEGGRGTVVDCPLGEAYNYLSGNCEPYVLVPPPCGALGNDCNGKPDGRYPILAWNCTYYYTCQDNLFFGSNPCNNPPDTGDLVFDEAMQLCNWRWDVPPPCGTFEGKAKPTNDDKAKLSNKKVKRN
jgi:hypothetical protein